MGNNTKEVYFNYFCQRCVNAPRKETEEPCNECLSYPWNMDSHKPVNFKEVK